MIQYRAFRNSDPPALADIWRSQAPFHRLAQPMSAGMLEDLVFSKTFFDPGGLIVAVEGARPVGFIHASFGPNDDNSALDKKLGVIARLMVAPRIDSNLIASQLLEAGEHYLRSRGAVEAVIGNGSRNGPFYLGLYAGAQLAGIVSDDPQLTLFTATGYEQVGECQIVQRSLLGFRPPVDRDQMRLRRQYDVLMTADPVPRDWWEANATSSFERLLTKVVPRFSFELVPKSGGTTVAKAIVWNLEPMATSWGIDAAGFEEITATGSAWQDGSALLLTAEAMRLSLVAGSTLVEAVVQSANTPVEMVLRTLGFEQVASGLTLKKSLIGEY